MQARLYGFGDSHRTTSASRNRLRSFARKIRCPTDSHVHDPYGFEDDRMDVNKGRFQYVASLTTMASSLNTCQEHAKQCRQPTNVGCALDLPDVR